MATSIYPTSEEFNKSEICKALFCSLYFSDLKLFLKDFNIIPNEKINSLNMGFLLKAYDHSSEEHRNDCKWGFGMVSDSDLMLAIEEYFEITSQQVENEKLYTERDDLLQSLFKNDTGTQVSLGDQTLRTILKTFNVPLESNHLEMRGMAKSYKEFSKQLANPFNCFWPALDLLACNRNWNSHTHDPRYAGIELHLFHRYVLFTYIGLVYVCRRIWTDSKCIGILGKRGINVPTCISEFSMPEQNITVNVTSPDVPITKCRVQVGSGKTREKKDYIPQPISQKYSFTTKATKYKELRLKFYRNSVENEISMNLNYQSWLISYDITLPNTISSSSCGTTKEPTFKLLLKLFGALDNKSEDIQNEISMMVKDIKDILIASVTRKDRSDRREYDDTLQSMLEDFNDTIANSTTSEDLKKDVQNINKKFEEQFEKINKFNTDFKEYVEQGIEPVSSYLKWLVPLSCLIISGFIFLLTALYPFNANIYWLQPEKKILTIFAAFLIIILPILSFAHFNPEKKWINIFQFTSKWQWSCLGAIVLFIFSSYFILPYKTQRDLINNYVFINNNDFDKNRTVIDLIKEFLIKNPKDEQAIVKLATYYIKYSEDIDSALIILDPIIEDYSKFKSGAISIAEAFYAKKNYVKVWSILDGDKNVFNDSIPAVARLKGVMYAYGQGKERDFFKGINLLNYASEKGDLEAMYWEGCIESSPELQVVYKNEDNDNIIWGYSGRYSLLNAIKLLRRASNLPNASIELGNIYADLNMIDSAKYYYQKAINLSQTKNMEALFQLGKLLFENGDSTNTYMALATMRNYPPAILFSALHSEDHITAIEQYKIFNDSIKSAKFPKKYRENYRYINPIVFEYIAANKPGYYNGLDSAYIFLTSSRPNGKFNMEFVKGVEAMTAKDSLKKSKAWEWIQQSANKGCLYAEMMCNFKSLRETIRNHKSDISSSRNHIRRLREIGDEIPFSNVLLSWIYRIYALNHEDNAFYSEFYIRKALLQNNIAAILILTVNSNIYLNFFKSITKSINILADSIPESPYEDIGEDSLQEAKSYFATTQMGLRYAPTPANKLGFITIGYDFDKMIYHYLYPNKEYPDEDFHFWCDVAMANHDIINECNFLSDYLCKSIMISRERGKEAGLYYLKNEPYVKRLIIAGLEDLIIPIPEQYDNLLSLIISYMSNDFYNSLTNRFQDDTLRLRIINNTNVKSTFRQKLRFVGWNLFLPENDENELLKECYTCFSPYHEIRLRDSINSVIQRKSKDTN